MSGFGGDLEASTSDKGELHARKATTATASSPHFGVDSIVRPLVFLVLVPASGYHVGGANVHICRRRNPNQPRQKRQAGWARPFAPGCASPTVRGRRGRLYSGEMSISTTSRGAKSRIGGPQKPAPLVT